MSDPFMQKQYQTGAEEGVYGQPVLMPAVLAEP